MRAAAVNARMVDFTTLLFLTVCGGGFALVGICGVVVVVFGDGGGGGLRWHCSSDGGGQAWGAVVVAKVPAFIQCVYTALV